jgi:hypothetical protein
MENKKFLKLLLVSVLIIFTFSSCKKEKMAILYDKDFEYVKGLAEKANKPFCIVISNADCPPCTSFIEKLEGQSNNPTDKAIFNIVNVSLPENKWYQQWICSVATPTTCIFSPQGELKAIVSGSKELCLDCIDSSIGGDTACSGHLYKSRFQSNVEPIPALNMVLECKLKFDKGEDITEELMHSFSRVQYPYNVYLYCMNAVRLEKSDAAADAAKMLTQFNDAFYYNLYGDLYVQTKSIANPDYSPDIDAILTVDKNLVLENCLVGQAKPFSITLTNTGKMPLSLYDITLSCSCVNLLSSKKQTINPGQSQKIDFELKAESKGELFREITFTSNAVNPIETVELTAYAE